MTTTMRRGEMAADRRSKPQRSRQGVVILPLLFVLLVVTCASQSQHTLLPVAEAAEARGEGGSGFAGVAAAAAQEEEEEREAAIERFRKYLSIHTEQPKPNYEEAAAFLFAQAEEIGLKAQRIDLVPGKPVILMTWQGKDTQLPSILLNSHVDVVPVENDKWFHDPFAAVRTAEGNVYARGAQDMKSVGMQYLEAIRVLRGKGSGKEAGEAGTGAGFEPLRTVHLSFVPDEEIGGHDGMEKLVKWEGFDSLGVGFALDEGLPSEGSDYKVFNAERGGFWVMITAKGKPGHGSMMYDGSATENLIRSLNAILEFRRSQFELVKSGKAELGEVISANVDFLRAGKEGPQGPVINVQPSEAVAGIDFRLPPTADVEAFRRRVEVEWAPEHRNMSFAVAQGVVRGKGGKPLITAVDDSNPYWDVFRKAVEKSGVPLSKPGIFVASTDARYLRAAGVPTLGFTPIRNTPVLLHAHNEILRRGCAVLSISISISISSFAIPPS
ncbi:hypothetical protein CBR_g20012 [Chara braunii]|uniref:N-acyl-aliphatic-L-amino acid amidohydrolase n=1 Tax=Chara braunii TaxID=69332 RepID=A0A388KZG8_CHABU|nr:hypothetical protein CBR_g20012 [Chara braunii]|eukprot:GBG75382.1 hypothetical protein CBR_g20012 [Chara braunii]